MKIFLKLLIVFNLTVICFACISTTVNAEKFIEKIINQFISGNKIDTNSKPLQTLEDSFEADPDGGPIIDQEIEIFELGNGKCLSLITLYNESSFGGYEGFVIFDNRNIITAMQRDFIFPFDKESISKEDITYRNTIDDSQRTKSILKDDFDRYSKKFNSKVFSTCR